MIAVDTNILVQAHREDSPAHEPASRALLELCDGPEHWAIPWPCVHEFIAITTHPKIFDPPSPLEVALDAIEVWLNAPNCVALGEGAGYFETLRNMALNGDIAGPVIHDARIAAICLHNGVRTLYSADRDFSRFPTLKTVNPLA